MQYSRNDVYPGSTTILPTVDQTIAENDSEMSNTVLDPVTNQRALLNKNMIWGAMLLLFGLMVALHFLGGD
jgi:hypothetical protein